MGQYFVAVNETKREWLHPHRFGDGLKFMEFGPSGGGFMLGVALLLRRSNAGGGGDWYGYSAPDGALNEFPVVGSWAGDAVSIVGDYDKSELYQTAMDSYKDVSFDVLRAQCADSSAKADLKERLKYKLSEDDNFTDEEEKALYRNLFKQLTFRDRNEGHGMEGNAPIVDMLTKAVEGTDMTIEHDVDLRDIREPGTFNQEDGDGNPTD